MLKRPDDAMTREQVVALAESHGWKVWGKLRKRGGSSYQPFRRKNDYLWVGLAFVERTGRGIAVDFRYDAKKVEGFIR